MQNECTGRWHERWNYEPKVKQEGEGGEKAGVCVTKTLFLEKIGCITKQHTMKNISAKTQHA